MEAIACVQHILTQINKFNVLEANSWMCGLADFRPSYFFPFLTFILIMSRRARLTNKKNEQNKTWDNKKLIFSVQQNYTTLK